MGRALGKRLREFNHGFPGEHADEPDPIEQPVRGERPRRRRAPLVIDGGRALLVAAAAAALLLACGRDDGGRLSRAELIERADAICAEYATRFAAVPEPEGDPTAPGAPPRLLRQAARVGRALAAVERAQVRELRELKPPERFEQRWHTALEDLEAGAAELDEAGLAAERGDREALARSFAAADEAGAQASRVAQGYRFRSCGSGS